MLDNIKEQYSDSIRPVVFPVIKFRDQIAWFVIGNTGKLPAYRLRDLIDKDFDNSPTDETFAILTSSIKKCPFWHPAVRSPSTWHKVSIWIGRKTVET